MLKKGIFLFFMSFIMLFNTFGGSVAALTSETTVDSGENCNCCLGDSTIPTNIKNGNIVGEFKGEFKDAKVMQDFRDFLREIPKEELNYKFNDFKWNEAQYTYYEEIQSSNVQVPHKESNYEVQKYLVFTFNENQISSPIIMEMEKTGEGKGIVTYKTLDDTSVVAIDINGENAEAQLITTQSNGGYWSCVQECLIKAWETIPAPVQWLCSAGCGGCIFGFNSFACATCVGCLGGYAIGCTTGCAFLR